MTWLFSVLLAADVSGAAIVEAAREPLRYETLSEPADTSRANGEDALAQYRRAPRKDEGLLLAVRALLNTGEMDDAWDLVEDHPAPSTTHAFFKAKLEAINANLAISGSLGKLKWAKRLRSHCANQVSNVPDDEDALECLAKFHARAPSIAGGDKAVSQTSLAALERLNAPRAKLVAAELVFREDPDAARALVDDAMGFGDVYDPGLLQAAMVYGYFKDWDEAQAVLARIPEGSELSGMRHYQMGKLAAEHGEKLSEGEQALLTFLTSQTRHLGVDFRGPAHWRLGQIFVHKERYGLANQAFKAALRYNPKLKQAKKDLKKLRALRDKQG